jgi:hypothetical protein
MDIFDEELLTLFKALSKVRFIVVGDVASNLHAQTKSGLTIEIWIDQQNKHFSNLKEKLQKIFHFNHLPNDLKDLDSFKFTTKNLLNIEIMTSVKGLENYTFENAYQMASIADISELKIPFLHINQLIQSKKAANRQKDQIDVIALEKIKRLREES